LDEIEVYVEAQINPTEDEEKVRIAMENIFGPLVFETQSQQPRKLVGRLKGMGELTKFSDLLRRERIRSATRRVLYGGMTNKSVVFYLNKQAAYVEHVSFSEPSSESPLGPIKVEIICGNPEELIDWLAPKIS
jgi:hypothetical protein